MVSPLGSLGALGPSSLPFGSANAAPSLGVGSARASFAATLADLATDAVGTMRHAEQAAAAGLKGQADTRAVVDAVMGAEQAFQTAVAIRDKIVTAYLEVSRMAI